MPLSPHVIHTRIAAVAQYDWLHTDTPEVAAWAAARDTAARAHLATLPQLERFRTDLHELLNVEVRQLPVVRGSRQFQLRRAAGAQQFSLWVSDEAGERVLIDAASIGSDHDSITEFTPSPDGETVAWAMSTGGGDWMRGRFRSVATGLDASDTLTGMKWPAFAWLDNSRIAYMSWGAAVEGQELVAKNEDASVRLHTLGTSQHEDNEIYRPSRPAWSLPAVSADGHWITVQELDGTTPAHVFRKPTTLDGEWETVVSGAGPDGVITVHNDETLVLSFVDNAAGSVIAHGDEARTLFAATDAAPISDAKVIGEHLVILTNALDGSVLLLQRLGGDSVSVPFGSGTRVIDFGAGVGDASVLVDVEELGGERHTVEVSFADPQVPAGESEWVSSIVEATSADGTLVPLKIVHARGVVPDGSAKVFLSVYGGFSVPYLATGYDDWHTAWLRAGGVLAYAGVRGGTERGEAWHIAATRHDKQNGIDDLIACIEWFERNGWSGAGSVAINGMSNGGMMVSAALTQAPGSIGAAIPEVPVGDMLNFHRYTVGHGWIREFGDPDVPEDAAYLAAYSPLHNVRSDVTYPPTLVLTADRDDRVPPGPHAYKLAAALRDAGAEVYLRVEADGGHGVGRSVTAKSHERAAVLAFAAAALGL